MAGPDDTAPAVLVVGDLNPDLVLRGDVVPRFGQAEQLLDTADLVLGGSAGIAAHAFARLGRSVGLVATVGDDTYGATALQWLHDAGVDTTTVLVRPGPTGISVVLSDGADRAILTHRGVMVDLTAAEAAAAVERLERRGLRHVHVCSVFLMPPLLAGLPELLQEWHSLGLTTSLDTNADPSGHWAGLDDVLPHLDVLLPNGQEAAGLSGGAGPEALAARGPLVVVKDGAAGARAYTPDGERHDQPAVSVDTVDTTGAGDTFDAVFLDGWLDGLDLDICLRRAVIGGARSVTASGGTAGQPTADDLPTYQRTS